MLLKGRFAMHVMMHSELLRQRTDTQVLGHPFFSVSLHLAQSFLKIDMLFSLQLLQPHAAQVQHKALSAAQGIEC